MIGTTPNIFGLFELDTAGTILYSKTNNLNMPTALPANLVGRNFFEEVTDFDNMEEFRQRFRYFAKGSGTAEKFTFNSKFQDSLVELNVMLTRISEREFDGEKKLIIVDIRFGN